MPPPPRPEVERRNESKAKQLEKVLNDKTARSATCDRFSCQQGKS